MWPTITALARQTPLPCGPCQQAGLLVTGIVNRETWAALQAQSCNCDKEE